MDNHTGNHNVGHDSDDSVSVTERVYTDRGRSSNGVDNGTPHVVTGGAPVADTSYASNGVSTDALNTSTARMGNGFVSVSNRPYDRNANGNGGLAGGITHATNTAVSIGDRGSVDNGRVSGMVNGNLNRIASNNASITDRLARIANSQDRGRQFYLFFERYRFILLNGQRDDRRHITRERVLLEQLNAFYGELLSAPDSVLVTRSVALIRALIAIVEQRIRAYSRNVSDANRMATLVMDYLADVMRL